MCFSFEVGSLVPTQSLYEVDKSADLQGKVGERRGIPELRREQQAHLYVQDDRRDASGTILDDEGYVGELRAQELAGGCEVLVSVGLPVQPTVDSSGHAVESSWV